MTQSKSLRSLPCSPPACSAPLRRPSSSRRRAGRAAAGQHRRQPQGSAPGRGPPPDTVGGPPAPVMFVTSVEVLRSDRAGGLDVVRARGLVTSVGLEPAAPDADHPRRSRSTACST